jgi:hypothetical protein
MSEAKNTPGPRPSVDLKEAEYLDAWTSRPFERESDDPTVAYVRHSFKLSEEERPGRARYESRMPPDRFWHQR